MWMLIGMSVALASGVEFVMSGPDAVLIKADSGSRAVLSGGQLVLI
jgi:hypothetical protein